MQNFLAAISSLGIFLICGSCGRYPDSTKTDRHQTEGASLVGDAERTGQNYQPLFLTPGYKLQDVSLEVKEAIVDIGNGYKYRAITYNGNFPATTISIEKNTLVRIKLTNKGSIEHSLHTHVIKYKPESDGTDASATPPNQTRYYYWEVTANTPSGFYPFHDHSTEGESALSRGLIGTVEVLDPGQKPGFAILLHDLDPQYLFSDSGQAIARGSGGGGHGSGSHGGGNASTEDMPAHLINGRFGDDPASRFKVSKGNKIKLGIVNLGSNIHNFHPHGNFFRDSAGKIGDVLELQPGAYQTVDLDAEAKGEWIYHCHVPGHPEGGMWSRYTVE